MEPKPFCVVAGSFALLRYKAGEEVDIGMRIRLVHGDELIADSGADGGSIQKACAQFKAWVRKHYFEE